MTRSPDDEIPFGRPVDGAEARLRSTLDSLMEGCQIIDREWRYAYVNPAAAQHGGRSVGELVGRTMWEAYPGIETTHMFSVLRRCMETRMPAELDNDFVTPDAVEKSFQLVVQPVPEGLFILSMDVTERKRAEAALGRVQERFQLAIANLQEGLVIADVRGQILHWNGVALSMHGFSSAEEGRGALARFTGLFQLFTLEGRLLPPEEWPLARLLTGEEFRDLEMRVRRIGAGWSRVFSYTGSIARTADQEPLAFLTIRDITEQKRAQDELRESERRFAHMLGSMELASLMLDPGGVVTYGNDYLLRLTGWKREELIGRNWFDAVVPAESVAALRETFAALLMNSPEAWHHENGIVSRDGETHVIRWNNSVLRSASGDVIGTASIGEDVTERREMERQFFRAQRMESIGMLAGGIAHDLNNVLMPILMGVTLLRRLPTDAKAVATIENVERAARRGADLVKQILAFSRGLPGSRNPVDVRRVMTEVAAIADSTFPKNISCTVAASPDAGFIRADETQIHQILINLAVNARDALPGGGRIRFAAESVEVPEAQARANGAAAGGRYVCLEVSDNGTGMTKAVMDRMFEPFFTTKESGRGTGLGLATVRVIARSHAGFLEVSSEIGAGTTFKVYLPLVLEEAPGSIPEPAGEELPRGNGELILVADDEQLILSVARQTLETFGYQVLTAGDGEQALALYAERASDISLVLIDMSMPVMGGIELAAALLRREPGIRIVATSGESQEEWPSLAADAGAKHFLHKPYSASKLLETIADALSGR